MVEIVKLSQSEKETLEKTSKELLEQEIQVQIDLLFGKADKDGLQALLKLYYRSYYFNDVYNNYWDMLVRLLNSDKSPERSRGIFLISMNTKWDKDNKFNEIIDEFLSHTEDEKAITSRQCIKSIENIIPYKKELHSKIKNKLQHIDYSKFNDNMKNLIFKDVTEILELLV